MKKILKICLVLVLTITLSVNASTSYKDVLSDMLKKEDTYNIDGKINVYFFHSSTCPHCADERSFLNSLDSNIKKRLNIYMYEVSDETNSKYLDQAKKKFLASSNGVPFTVIGKYNYTGFSNSIGKQMLETINKYISEYDALNGDTNNVNNVVVDNAKKIMDKYINAGGSREDAIYVKLQEKVNYLNNNNDETITLEVNTLIEEMESSIKNLPIIGNVVVKRVSIPLAALILGLIDGFNPCAMWVLLFLINMLFGMKNRKRMWLLGFTFLFASAFVYFLSMLGINFVTSYTSVKWIRLGIAVVALIGGILNIRSYLATKSSGCTVVDDKKRNKIFNQIKKFTSEKSLVLALIGVTVLAVSVNLVELACSLGFPMIFTEILALNNLNSAQEIIYILLYILFFLIDDIIVFVVAMTTLKLTGISTKYNRLSHLIGGVIMIIMGLLLIFNPNILMFNF